MSNFGVTYLLKTDRLSIEDNIGEELHIHFGGLRICLRNEEFKNTASKCLSLIAEASGVSEEILRTLDPIFLFDLCRRGELPSLKFGNEEYIEVGKLFCPVCNRVGLWRYRKIKHSSFLAVIEGKTKFTPFDAGQINYLGMDNYKRTFNVLEACKQDKNLCDNHPLLVTYNNVIRDGQHRAAAIYYLYGPKALVKIRRIDTNATPVHFDPQKPWKQLGLRYAYLYCHRCIGKILRRKGVRTQTKPESSLAACPDQEAFARLKERPNLQKLVFFVDKGVALARFPVLIRRRGVKREAIIDELQKSGMSTEPGHRREGFTFIYGLKEDSLVVDDRGTPVAILQDNISSKAMSVRSFMPFSPVMQRYINGFDVLPECVLYILRITKCLFDKDNGGFASSDIEYFDSRAYLLDDPSFRDGGLLEDAFFAYSERLVKLLRGREYNLIQDDYRRFEY